ncbi:MAG: hypothetical protein QF662_02855 [Phycisphaerae bacterium]|jgi:hypothetical protein|nr:hypothetical protein [Phycisphaerae bacterium]
MNRKWIAVGVMAAITVGLAVLLGQVLQPPQEAFAQGGRYADYVTGTATFGNNAQAFVVIDTANRRVIFYEYDINKKELSPTTGYDLPQGFGIARGRRP